MFVHNPSKFTLLQLYCKHRRFFYLNYMENFKLFANWYLQNHVDLMPVDWTPLPWYSTNYEVQELAKILKLSQREVLSILQEIHDE